MLSAPIAAQIDAGLLARVRDREITTRYDSSTNRTQISLSLAPAETGGGAPALTLTFVAQLGGRGHAGGAPTLNVRAHITPKSDPRERDPRTGAEGRELVFRVDPHTGTGITLYLYATSWGYPGFVAPGDEILVAFFSFTPEELRALNVARSITGRALGSEFTLAPEQLVALREFASRVAP